MGPRPRVVFAPNNSQRRTLDAALKIAAEAGIEWDANEIEFFERRSHLPLAANLDAMYFDRKYVTKASVFTWGDVANRKSGKVHVYVAPHVFESDENIVGVFAHEVYEITHLSDEFIKLNRQMSGERLHSLIDPEVGTLHCEAWDYADGVVERRRGAL